MITETAYLETKSTMVATDQSTDFTNCENKSETLNVVTNGNFSFRSTASTATKLNETKLTETENELDDIQTDDDLSRPKKLQKGLNQGLIGNNNLINQQQQQQSSLDDNLKSNKLLTENENHSNSQQQSTGSRRKQNLIDNEYEDNFECLISKDSSTLDCNNSSPKVPPLRIVISSSTASRNSKDHLNQTNSNYVVSTAAVDSQSSNSSINDKREDNNSFYLTRSSANGGAQSSNGSSNVSSTSTTGRITRSSQRAAAATNHHLTNDDSQSRYSPDEFNSNDNDDEPQQPPQTIYLSSQTIKEKESNKENKDLRRRKGRGKVSLQSSNLSSGSSAAVSSVNNGTSTINTISNQQSSTDSMIEDQTMDQTMINLSTVNLPNRDYQMPSYNCYNMFQNIRKQVEKRRQTMCDSMNPSKQSNVTQKPPQGFKNYLLSTGNYLLESRNQSMRNVNPNLTIEQIEVPDMLLNLPNTDKLIDLYKEQELEREKLKVQHLVEREKVKLSIEQEILRVHNRASLAMANQSLPLSFTVIMKDEEIYNPIDQDQDHSFDRNNLDAATNQKETASSTTKNEYSRATYTCQSNNTYTDLYTLTGKSEDIGSRCRYSGRLLHSWLQDVEDKWSKIKKEILNRQKREAESLQAIQKLNWEWRVKELSKILKIDLEEDKSADKFDEKQWSENLLSNDKFIPLIKISEEFDFS